MCLRDFAFNVCSFSFLFSFIFLRALSGFMFLRALSAFIFLRALCALTFFIRRGTIHSQLQQVGISKNEVEWTKNSLNKPKQLRAILENYV